MTTATSGEFRWWCGAIGCFALVALLGISVAFRTPTRLDVEAIALRGEAVPLATCFTALGRWYVLAPLAAVLALVTFQLRGDVRVIGVLATSQLLAQGANTLVKALFHRPRPDYWLVVHDTDFSYPSGHAVTAVVFYLALTLIIVRSGLLPRPVAVGAAIALGCCVIGIPWSRLALGAHYLSDVAGGMLFGAGWLCMLLALAARFWRVAV